MATAASIALLSSTLLLFTLGFILVIVATSTPWLTPREASHTQIISVGLSVACFDNHVFETIDPVRRTFDGCVSLTSAKFDDIQEHINPDWFQDIQRIHFVSILLSSLLAILAIVFMVVYCGVQRQVKRGRPLRSLLFAKAGLILTFVILCGLTTILLIVEPSKFYHNFEENQATFFDNTNSQLIYSTGFSSCIGAAVLLLLTTVSGSVLMAGIFRKMNAIFEDGIDVYGRGGGSDDYSYGSETSDHDKYVSQEHITMNPAYSWSNTNDNKSQVSEHGQVKPYEHGQVKPYEEVGRRFNNNGRDGADGSTRASVGNANRPRETDVQSYRSQVQSEAVSEYEREPSRIKSIVENPPDDLRSGRRQSKSSQKPMDSPDEEESVVTKRSTNSRRRSQNGSYRDGPRDFDQDSRASGSYSRGSQGGRDRGRNRQQERDYPESVQEVDESVHSGHSKRRRSSHNRRRDEDPESEYVERRRSSRQDNNPEHRHSRGSIGRRSKSYDDWDQQQDSSTERKPPRRNRSRDREEDEHRRNRSRSDGARKPSRSNRQEEPKSSHRPSDHDRSQRHKNDHRRRSQPELLAESSSQSEYSEEESTPRYDEQPPERGSDRAPAQPARGHRRSHSPRDQGRKAHRSEHTPDGRSHSSQELEADSASDNNLQREVGGWHDRGHEDQLRQIHRTSSRDNRPKAHRKPMHGEGEAFNRSHFDDDSNVFVPEPEPAHSKRKHSSSAKQDHHRHSQVKPYESSRHYEDGEDLHKGSHYEGKPRNYSEGNPKYYGYPAKRPDPDVGPGSSAGSGNEQNYQVQYRPVASKTDSQKRYSPVERQEEARPTPARRKSAKSYDESSPAPGNPYGRGEKPYRPVTTDHINQLSKPSNSQYPVSSSSRPQPNIGNNPPGGDTRPRYDRPVDF